MLIDHDHALKLVNHTRAIQQKKQLLGQGRKAMLYPPRERSVAYSGMTAEAAQRAGIDPVELERHIHAIMANPSDDEVVALKQLVMLSKLRRPEVTIKLSDEVRFLCDEYEKAMISHQDKIEKVDAAQGELDILMQSPEFSNVLEYWTKVIDSMIELVATFDDVITNIPEESPNRIFLEILIKNSKHVNKVPNPNAPDTGSKLLVANWSHVRSNFSTEHMLSIFRIYGEHMQKVDLSEFLNEKGSYSGA